ncbi:MAG: homoserine dehydrogenase [Dehalococcoidia bacterium]|nr:MAG: homoserine dehydrogenase [Dehalococcoidia bacterium]
MKKAKVGIGIIGLGVVAGQVARVLLEKGEDLSRQVGCQLVIRRIKVLEEDLKRPLAGEIDRKLFVTSDDDLFNDPEIDIIVEAIGGENPAFAYLKRALDGGRHVVTSNKEVIAKHGTALGKLAAEHSVSLRYEGSVGGGIPLISRFQYDLVANRINGIYAIINGTTNYILSRMAREGIDFDVALKNAQALGYAEANPANDIEGIDAVYKLAILATLAFQTPVSPEDVYREGISRLGSRDFQYACELGFAIKLLAIAKSSDGRVEARVHPVLIPENLLLAKVDGVYNAILVRGDLVGDVLFYGEGAGANPTASAVVADIVAAARAIMGGNAITSVPALATPSGNKIKPISQIETRYYLRMTVTDDAGVLAQIARVLGDHRISISQVIQKTNDDTAKTAEIVIMTHPARGDSMQTALDEFGRLGVVKEVSNFIRVEEIGSQP